MYSPNIKEIEQVEATIVSAVFVVNFPQANGKYGLFIWKMWALGPFVSF